ncbi:SseB family protein, partial [Klebsiella pneumoniae]|uniref:SseB family protein n=1 Tax=Klebsiella pneumoniae TaxID=573 RepID=UPI003463CD13
MCAGGSATSDSSSASPPSSTVWVPGRAADGEQIVEDSALDLQHWEKDDGTSVIPFFTSLEA